MKRSFYALGIITLFAVNQTTAQNSELASLARTSADLPLYAAPTADVKDYSLAAAESFRKSYKNIQNEKWSQEADRYRVTFKQDDIIYAVDYTKKGKLYSTIRHGQMLLHAEHLRSLNAAFSDPKVLTVSEVKMCGYADIVYVIVLEDKYSVKSVQIIGNDLEVISEQPKKG